MTGSASRRRVYRIFRYDPARGGEGHFDRFELAVENEHLTTILDVLLRIQRTLDSTLAFRYACRVYMCGSCGMVINGKESLACKTILADLQTDEVTIRPLNHFPVVKDLVVDMDAFFRKYEEGMTYFHAVEERSEPAVIRPDSPERRAIASATECIACGCCVSSCTMVHWHDEYLGPAALNRVFTLLADSRDGLREERLGASLASCYHCRTEVNCTAVCPKDISPTRAIKYIQTSAAKLALSGKGLWPTQVQKLPLAPAESLPAEVVPSVLASRRRFLSRATLGVAALTVFFLGGVLTATALVPALRRREETWVDVGRLDDFAPGTVKTVEIRYPVKDGFYESEVRKPVFVTRSAGTDQWTVHSSRCSHLGCQLRWDDRKKLFLCDCHGGQFYPDGKVKAGPPPRPMDRYATRIRDGRLFVREA